MGRAVAKSSSLSKTKPAPPVKRVWQKMKPQTTQLSNLPLVPRGILTAPFSHSVTMPISVSGSYSSQLLQITFTNNKDTAQEFVDSYISSPGYLGFDLEHRPTYKPGQKPNIALLQFAPPSRDGGKTHPVLLYSLYHDSGIIPDCLQAVIRDVEIKKYGIGINGDIKHLHYMALSSACKESFVELGTMAYTARLVERKTIGLKALIAATMGEECCAYKTKGLTMTNWELANLNDAQQKYAAMDAFAGLEIFRLISAGLVGSVAPQVKNVVV